MTFTSKSLVINCTNTIADYKTGILVIILFMVAVALHSIPLFVLIFMLLFSFLTLSELTFFFLQLYFPTSGANFKEEHYLNHASAFSFSRMVGPGIFQVSLGGVTVQNKSVFLLHRASVVCHPCLCLLGFIHGGFHVLMLPTSLQRAHPLTQMSPFPFHLPKFAPTLSFGHGLGRLFT